MKEEIKQSVSKYEGKRKRAAIAKCMFEHPVETRKTAIGKALNADRSTVAKYYNEIRREIDSIMAKRV